MSRLYDMTSTVSISTYVQFEIEEETQQIISTSLDGTVYIQNVGSPQKNYVGSVYVTRDEKTLLMWVPERVPHRQRILSFSITYRAIHLILATMSLTIQMRT